MPRHAAVQADRVLAALLHLERDIHGVGLRIALDVGGFFLLQHFEIAELVQAQDAEVPQLGIEHVAFVEQDFAADDLVARGGVAGEIDAADEELLAFVGGQGEIDLVACLGTDRRRARARNRCSRTRRRACACSRCPCAACRWRRRRPWSCRTAASSALRACGTASRPRSCMLRRWYSVPSSTGIVISAEMPGLVHLEQRQAPALAAAVLNVDGVVQGLGREVAVHPGRPGGCAPCPLRAWRGRRSWRRCSRRRCECGIAEGPAGSSSCGSPSGRLYAVLPVISMLPTLTLGPSFTYEGDLQRRGRNLLDLRIHRGVLAAALGQEFLEDDGGALDLVGVVLRFHREADLALLEAVENFRDGDATGCPRT